MKTTSIFLGTKGLSQSEANHTANISKEIAETVSGEISGMSLFKKTLNDTFGKTAYNFVKRVDDLKTKCMEEGKIYALSAWLREGIKAKATMLAMILSASAEDLGFATNGEPEQPILEETPQEADMINGLSIADRAEYLTCEAKAAHIGKKVHSKGLIPQWKHQLAMQQPVEFIQGTNAHMRIDIEQIISLKEVDELFYELQKEHREVESRLNYYKAMLHNLFNQEVARINSANAEVIEAYRTKQADYRTRYEVSSKLAEAKRALLLKEISDLKVIIPDSLQETLDYVQSYSKKKG